MSNIARTRSNKAEPCIYCSSVEPPTKREHVMSRALGSFAQNWTLDCVCDSCNQVLCQQPRATSRTRQPRSAPQNRSGSAPGLRCVESIKPPRQDDPSRPGAVRRYSLDAAAVRGWRRSGPDAGAQVALRRAGGDWRFLIEKELIPQNLEELMTAADVEIRICGVGSDCQRLKERLNALEIGFQRTKHLTDQLITEQSSVSVIHDMNVDETLVRAACKIVFNYAAKVLGSDIIRDSRFDAARRFVRYGEAPTPIAACSTSRFSLDQMQSPRGFACGLGWDRGYWSGSRACSTR